MLEKMGEFFDSRLDIYDEHQLTCIDSASEFLRFTAECLPTKPDTRILDLGCGTGLELEEYYKINPTASVVGIDLASGMLKRLSEKLAGKSIELIVGSYFDVPFGEECFDAAVSVESLHHFTYDEKLPLYLKLAAAVRTGGCFVLTDYFSLTDDEEREHRAEFLRLKTEQGITDDEFYHYDTPLTVAHECDCLKAAGFSSVEILNRWSATVTVRAVK